MSMPRWTLLLAGFLVLLGVGFYLGTGRESVTALIPTFLGLPLLACAVWARRSASPARALPVAFVLALVGLAGTAAGLVKSVRLLAGQEVVRPEAAVAQALVALACLAYVLLGVRNFLRSRASSASATT